MTPAEDVPTAAETDRGPSIARDMTEGEVADLLGSPRAALETGGTTVWRYKEGVVVFAGGRVREWTPVTTGSGGVSVRNPMLSSTQRIGEALPRSSTTKVWAPPRTHQTRIKDRRNDRLYPHGRTPYARARRSYLPSAQEAYRNHNRAQLASRWLYKASRRHSDTRYVRADQRRTDIDFKSDRYQRRLHGTPRLTRELNYRFRSVPDGQVRGR